MPGRISPPEGPGVIPSGARNLALIVFSTYAPATLPWAAYQAALKSFQSRFTDSIRATFFFRPQLLIYFSRVMAAKISPDTS